MVLYRYLKSLLNKRSNISSVQGQMQKMIESQWVYAAKKNVKIFEDIRDSGFRCYSQFEEDGIILYLLSLVGKKKRTVVEICCGTGDECMAANLIINHGFKGYLFDGSAENVRAAKRFFKGQKDCLLVEPSIEHAWITRSNVNDLLKKIGAIGEIDLLSLDMDGNDYYIWQAIEVINPRICVFEIHNIIPSDLALTIPYSDGFYAMDKRGGELDFRSVSLLAMIKLSTSKGYTMVGSHKHGFNVFFVRNDLLNDLLPRPTIDQIDDNEWTRSARKDRWPLVKDYPWVEV
ncbi:MAG: hypothetical protein CMO06_12880 [Thalassospira sp.]|nr:hypothetical protein [Thalassospira sp.]